MDEHRSQEKRETAETVSRKAKILDKPEVIFDLVCEASEILMDALT